MKKYKTDLERIDAAWNKLEPLLDEKKRPLVTMKGLAIAASLFLMMALGILFWNNERGMIVYSTRYGETAKVMLPDSSVVMLNGNTKLRFPKHWPATGDREVEVDGEAYFSIKHTENHQKFYVRMEGSTSVEVLGTEFNVSKRGNKMEVVLNSGKIALHIPSPKADEERVIPMKPGDLVAYDKQKQHYTKKFVNPEVYSSWKSSKLIFDKTELKEVLDILKNTYGLKIRMDDQKLMNMTISGSAPTKNVDLLIGALSEILDLKFTKTGNTLMITSK